MFVKSSVNYISSAFPLGGGIKDIPRIYLLFEQKRINSRNKKKLQSHIS